MKFDDDMMQDLRSLKKEGERILEKYETSIIETLRRQSTDAEEMLREDVLFEVLDHLSSFCELVTYMGEDVVKEGQLSRDENGTILLDGEPLPLMTHLEVFIHDDHLDQSIWFRTFVAGTDFCKLVGIDRSVDINGMKARLRG